MSFIDLVVSGPDLSGTSTQVKFLISFFKSLGKKVRDISGTEIDALFHAEIFKEYNETYLNLKEFLADRSVSDDKKKEFIYRANDLLLGRSEKKGLKVASMYKNDITTYVNPDSADVWVMEEPTRRGAGQTNRTFEQNRTKFGSEMDPVAASFCHQVYRLDEFYRFRKVLREKGKIIIRSRSEESACYQIYDRKSLPKGISKSIYIRLPGNKVAFENPPTHIFIACAEGMTKEQYIDAKTKRGKRRILDDHELNVDYQLLVNKRYSTDWINHLYGDACKKYNSKVPEITRFNMFDSLEKIKNDMENKIKKILEL